MVGSKYSKKERTRHRAQQASQAAEQYNTMDVDVQSSAESSAAAEQNPNTTEPAHQGENDDNEIKTLHMREVAEALHAATNHSSEKNVGALLSSVDFDVVRLTRMALDSQNSARSVAVLLSTAIMMSENRARDAEEMAAVADRNCDGVFGRTTENAQAILSHGEHISAIQRRISILESVPPVLPTAADNPDGSQIAALQTANARLEARLQILEQQFDQHSQLAEGAMLNSNPGDDIQAIMGRMQVLADLRRGAEISLFERRDQQRQLALEQLKQEVCDEKPALANERARLASVRRELQTEYAELRSHFRMTCMHLVASAYGDITPDELRERLAQLYLPRN